MYYFLLILSGWIIWTIICLMFSWRKRKVFSFYPLYILLFFFINIFILVKHNNIVSSYTYPIKIAQLFDNFIFIHIFIIFIDIIISFFIYIIIKKITKSFYLNFYDLVKFSLFQYIISFNLILFSLVLILAFDSSS